jgi:hypothetical protein
MRADMREKIENILFVLGAAASTENVDLPGFRLHPLKGDLRSAPAGRKRTGWLCAWMLSSPGV